MDQKKLREMMRREKEKRAAEGGGDATQRQKRLPHQGKKTQVPIATSRSLPNAGRISDTQTNVPGTDTVITRESADSRKVYPHAGECKAADDESPPLKRLCTEASATQSPGCRLDATKIVSDAVAMPPPRAPLVRHTKVSNDMIGVAGLTCTTSNSSSRDELPQQPISSSEAPSQIQSVAKQIVPSDQDASPRHAIQALVQEPEEPVMEQNLFDKASVEDDTSNTQGDAAQNLPAGFFDDPEQDAKVRGVEAPSIRAQRELEEGLKRFERELLIETEKAEETRHELDEEKYEDAAAEEMQFQQQLHGRLERLRQEATTRREKKKGQDDLTVAGAPLAESHAGQVEDPDSDSSDSDVRFDWRAKSFG